MSDTTALLIGNQTLLDDAQTGVFKDLPCDTLTIGAPYVDALQHYDIIIDLELDRYPQRLKQYLMLDGTLVVGCAVFKSLHEMVADADWPVQCRLFGINALPGMLQRDVLEVSRYSTHQDDALLSLTQGLDADIEWVADRVGMVTPRMLALILNEAFWMHTEGAATPEAIDNAMRKGVNYPKGPFAWAAQIGHQHLVDLLKALQSDGQPARYPIAPALRQAALQDQIKLNETR